MAMHLTKIFKKALEEKKMRQQNAPSLVFVFQMLIFASLLIILPNIVFASAPLIDCRIDLHCSNIGGCGSDHWGAEDCDLNCGLKLKEGMMWFQIDCGNPV